MDKLKKNKGLDKIKSKTKLFRVWILFRFAKNLMEAKQIGIKKGLYMGICQAVAQILIHISFAVTFYCKDF